MQLCTIEGQVKIAGGALPTDCPPLHAVLLQHIAGGALPTDCPPLHAVLLQHIEHMLLALCLGYVAASTYYY